MEVNEYTKWLIKQADENRANQTISEQRTETALKNMRIDYKSQIPIMVGPNKGYIADFTINTGGYNVILEVDGSTHIGSKKKDAQRTRDLRKKGWNVIRIKNEDTISYSHLTAKINGLLGKFRRKDKKVSGIVNPITDDLITNTEVTDTTTGGYAEIPHSVWEVELPMQERYFFVYLLDCENRFNKNGEWFELVDEDFINIGFGRDKVVLRQTRNSLIERGWIEFKRGGNGVKSKYRINRNKD